MQLGKIYFSSSEEAYILLLLLWLPLLFLGMEAIQVHAVNLIEISLEKRWQPILNQSWVTGSPTTNKEDCHWWVPKSRLLRHARLATSQL